jgi:ABC-type Na+ efflux pump permease subunit
VENRDYSDRREYGEAFYLTHCGRSVEEIARTLHIPREFALAVQADHAAVLAQGGDGSTRDDKVLALRISKSLQSLTDIIVDEIEEMRRNTEGKVSVDDVKKLRELTLIQELLLKNKNVSSGKPVERHEVTGAILLGILRQQEPELRNAVVIDGKE